MHPVFVNSMSIDESHGLVKKKINNHIARGKLKVFFHFFVKGVHNSNNKSNNNSNDKITVQETRQSYGVGQGWTVYVGALRHLHRLSDVC